MKPETLTKIRLRRRASQKSFAFWLGVSARTLRRYESGQIAVPTWLIRRLQPVPLRKGEPVDFEAYQQQGSRIKDGMHKARQASRQRVRENLKARFPQV